jgi:nitroimidazol reductase NimA-like FMN-containing flavoprotein (pyridoxamine 5'-phosphate oxidase superfamily)
VANSDPEALGSELRMTAGANPPSTRARVRRHPERGRYERATVDAILDEALVCHVGFVHDGHPYVIPMLHARVGDELYLHGSAASRMLRALSTGTDVCVTATLVDGLVLARSVFDHSVNYRSAVVLGRALLVHAPTEKEHALSLFTEKLVPGRWSEARPPTPTELKATAVLRMALEEYSAKVREGGPGGGDGPDAQLDVWAGIVPLAIRAGTPEADPLLRPDIPMPASVGALLARFHD